MYEEVVGNARRTLSHTKGLLDQLGLKYIDLPEHFAGVGLALGFGDGLVEAVSVLGQPNDEQVMVTGGVLRDLPQERAQILDICNRHTQNITSFPAYLHDAEAGWDVLVGARYPIGVLTRSPDFLDAILRAIPQLIERLRSDFADAGISGSVYTWNEADVNRLFIRSLL